MAITGFVDSSIRQFIDSSTRLVLKRAIKTGYCWPPSLLPIPPIPPPCSNCQRNTHTTKATKLQIRPGTTRDHHTLKHTAQTSQYLQQYISQNAKQGLPGRSQRCKLGQPHSSCRIRISCDECPVRTPAPSILTSATHQTPPSPDGATHDSHACTPPGAIA